MLKFNKDNIRKIITVEFIPTIPIDESPTVGKDIYGFSVEFRQAPGGGMRNLGHATYFKVRKVKPNTLIEAKPHKLVRIFFTHPECVKHSPMRENWELEGKDKRNINKYLGQYIGKLDSKLDIPEYEGMTLYSFLILLADKAYRGYGPDFSNIDREIIERSKQDPMFVGKDFISIYYPKPDYSKMKYIN